MKNFIRIIIFLFFGYSANAQDCFANAGVDMQDCSLIIELNGAASGGTASWSGDGTFLDPFSFQTSVEVDEYGTYDFVLSITDGDCSDDDVVQITFVEPSLSIDAGNDQTICSNIAFLEAELPIAGFGFWTIISGSGQIPNPNDPNAEIVNMEVGTTVLEWTVFGYCGNASDQLTINVSENSAVVSAGGNTSICSESYDLQAESPGVNLIGTWSIIEGSGDFSDINDPNATVSNLTLGVNVLRWTVDSDCGASFDEVQIIVSEGAIDANAGNNASICEDFFNINGNSVSGATGAWSVIQGTGIVTNPFNAATQVTNLSIGDNILQWTLNSSCGSDSDQIEIVVGEGGSVAYAGQNVSICNTSYQLTALDPGTGLGTWSFVQGSADISDANDPNATLSSLEEGIYILNWSVAGDCGSSSDQVTISVGDGALIAYAGEDITTCTDEVELNAAMSPFGEGAWSVVSGTAAFSDNESGQTIITGLSEGENIIEWTISDPTCGAAVDQIIIEYIASGDEVNAGADAQICQDLFFELDASLPENATGTWSSIPEGVFSNEHDPNATFSITEYGIYVLFWTVIIADCDPIIDEVVLEFGSYPSPSIPGDNNEVCGLSYNLNAVDPEIGTGQWYGFGVFGNANDPQTTVTVTEYGTHEFTWVVSNCNCEPNAESVSISFYEMPSASAGEDIVICNDINVVSLNANTLDFGIGKWSVVSGTAIFSDLHDPNALVSGLSPGDNVLQWEITNGPCVDADLVVVTLNPGFAISVTSNSPVCLGETIALFAAGGSTYSWVGPNGFTSDEQNPSIENASFEHEGIYEITITDNDGCEEKGSVSVDVLELPEPTASNSGPVCAGESIQLFASGGESYQWNGPNGFSSIEQNPIINVTNVNNSGTYTVIVNGENSCSADASTEVEILPLPNIIIDANSPLCEGDVLQLSASGGTTYSWVGPNGFASNVQNPVVSNVTTLYHGTYTVYVDGENGCSNGASVDVIVDTYPIGTITPVAPLCEGDPIYLYATGGASYSWTGPNGFTSNIQNPVIENASLANSGFYTATISSQYGCNIQLQVFVQVNANPIVVIEANNPVCEGDAIFLSANGGTSYVWSGPSGYISFQQHPIIYNSSFANEGVYTVEVSNTSNCTTVAQITVDIVAAPIVAASFVSPACEGSALQLNASGGISYFWEGPNGFSSTQQNPVIPVVDLTYSGYYTVTAYNAEGCSSEYVLQVTINPAPFVTILTNSPVCSGEILNFQAGYGVSYLWTGPNGFVSNIFNPSIPNATTANSGTYTVLVTDELGCTNTEQVNVQVNAGPNASASNGGPVCEGEPVQLFASGGTSYLWTGPNGFASSLQNPVINNASVSQSGLYSVTVSNTANCPTTATTTVTIFDQAEVTIIADDTVCDGDVLYLSTNISGISYQWSGPNGFSSSLQNPSIPNISFLDAGNYSVVVNFGNGCSATDQIYIDVLTTNKLAITNNGPLCIGETLQLFAGSGQSYFWTGPNGFFSSFQNPTIPNVTLANAGIYMLQMVNYLGCSIDFTTNVIIQSAPNVNASGTGILCEGETIQLSSSGGTSYQWTGPNGFNSNNQNPIINNASLSNSGVYTVSVTNTNGCTGSAQVTVQVNQQPFAQLSSNSPICSGDNITLSASGGTSYQWTGPNGYFSNQQNPIIANASVLNGGVYTVEVSSGSCSSSGSVTVLVTENTFAQASANTPVCEGEIIQLSASGGSVYYWTGPNGYISSLQNPQINNASSINEGTYTVEVSNGNCISFASIYVDVSHGTFGSATSNSPVCDGNDIQLFASGGSSYAWNGPNGFISSLQNPVITNASNLNGGIYNVEVMTSSGCTSLASVTVNIAPSFSGAASSNSPVCEGSNLLLSASGGVSYAWSGPNGFISNLQNPQIANVTSFATGIYTVQIASQLGCLITAQVTVSIHAGPSAFAGQDMAVCGLTTTVSATSNTGQGFWTGPAGITFGNVSSVTTSVQANTMGIYNITWTTVSEVCGTAEDQVTITFDNNGIAAEAGPNQTVCGLSTNLNAILPFGAVGIWSGNGTFSNPSNANTNVSVNSYGTYNFNWTVQSGDCPADSDIVTITFEDCGACNDQLEICTEPVVINEICVEFCDVPDAVITSTFSLYHCSIDVNENNCLNYTALPGFYGQDYITIIGCNSFGLCDTVYVDVFVGDCEDIGNQPPVAITDFVTIVLGQTSIVIQPINNDYDPDNDPITITGISDPLNGTAILVNGVVTYTANSGFYGTDIIVYTLCDDNGLCTNGVIEIYVPYEINDCENELNYCTQELTPITICLEFCDIGEDFEIIEAISSYHCAIIINDNCITYTPLPGYVNATDFINIEACDSQGNCQDIEVYIYVGEDCDIVTECDVVANASGDFASCSLTTQLNAQTPADGVGQWSSINDGVTFGNILAASSSIIVPGYGIYSFVWTVTNDCGSVSDVIHVTFYQNAINVDAGIDQHICDNFTTMNASVPLNAVATWGIVSGNGLITNFNDPNTTITELNDGMNVFEWSVYDENCGFTSDYVNIYVNEPGLCDGDCTSDINICVTPVIPEMICIDFCDIDASGAITSVFSQFQCSVVIQTSNCFTYTGLPLFVGTDYVTVTACDNDGVCEEIIVEVYVGDCGDEGLGMQENENEKDIDTERRKKMIQDLYVPNALSPNNDGINDAWTLSLPESMNIVEGSIFDKTGKVVVSYDSSEDNNIVWNGQNKNLTRVNEGAYFYKILIEYKGHILLKSGFIEVRF